MKQQCYLIPLFFIFFLYACTSESSTKEEATEVINPALAKNTFFKNVYNQSKIKGQTFKIRGSRDTTIVSRNGTIYKIYANTFETTDGSIINGDIKIKIKEVFKKSDFVMGNLTTTSNNRILESDGMFYIGASAKGKKVKISDGKEVGIIVPDKSKKDGMSIFEGEKVENAINWVNPVNTLNNEAENLEQSYKTITYTYSPAEAYEKLIKTPNPKVNNWLWESNRKVGDSLFIEDSYITILEITTSKVKLSESGSSIFIQDVVAQKGRNGFVEDFNTNYIFSVKKLGWANIDRLYNNPKSEKVDLLVDIENEKEFDFVFTSMIFTKNKIYLPGYQKEDHTFGFSHNDNEKSILPIGTEVTILATAYKNEKPFFNMKKFKIQKEQNISFALQETNFENLKETLDKNL